MKKYCLFFLALTLSLGLLAGAAYAANPTPPLPQSNTPYMTLNNSNVQKTTFGWNEQPFSYLWLPSINSSLLLNVKNVWKYGATIVDTQNLSYSNISSLQNWTGLANWNTVRQMGDWTLETTWGYAGSRYNLCTVQKFTVTPEPVSAALFLIGGLALTSRKFFKGKKKHMVLLLALTLGLGLMAGTGYAINAIDPIPPFPQDDTPYMTLDGNTAQKVLFGWSEKPFVYLNLPSVNPSLVLNLEHVWRYGSTVVATQNFTFTGASSLLDWRGLSNWSSVRQLGDWTVTTEWGYEGSRYLVCCTETKFTVTPEPISAALFLIGGVALTTRKFFKSKK